MALLYGDDDFQRSLMIVNTAGWDTDCNSGNVGCLLGIESGLAAIDGDYDWRGPVADRLYLSTADGGRAITDAVTETLPDRQGGQCPARQEFGSRRVERSSTSRFRVRSRDSRLTGKVLRRRSQTRTVARSGSSQPVTGPSA